MFCFLVIPRWCCSPFLLWRSSKALERRSPGLRCSVRGARENPQTRPFDFARAIEAVDVDIKPPMSTTNHKCAHVQTHDKPDSRNATPMTIAPTSSQLCARSVEDTDILELSQSSLRSAHTNAHPLSTLLSAVRTRRSAWRERRDVRANQFVISDDETDPPAPLKLTPKKMQRTVIKRSTNLGADDYQQWATNVSQIL